MYSDCEIALNAVWMTAPCCLRQNCTRRRLACHSSWFLLGTKGHGVSACAYCRAIQHSLTIQLPSDSGPAAASTTLWHFGAHKGCMESHRTIDLFASSLAAMKRQVKESSWRTWAYHAESAVMARVAGAVRYKAGAQNRVCSIPAIRLSRPSVGYGN
jgi:hypothetical protein